MRFQFFKTVLLLSLLLAVLLAWPLYAWTSPAVLKAILAAAAISICNTIIGTLTIEYGFDKSNKVFMFAVFGGMQVRMILILVALTILLLNKYHALALALSLMGFYAVFLTAEIIYVSREMGRRKASDKATSSRSTPNNLQRTILSVDERSI
jgi:hypothetical protein